MIGKGHPINIPYKAYKCLTNSQRVKLGKLNYLIRKGKFEYHKSGSISSFLDSVSWDQIRSLFGSSWEKPKRERLGKNTVAARQSLPDNPVPSRSGRPTLNKNHGGPGRVSQRAGGNGLNALGQLSTVSGAEWDNQHSPLNSPARAGSNKMPLSDEQRKAQVQERQ